MPSESASGWVTPAPMIMIPFSCANTLETEPEPPEGTFRAEEPFWQACKIGARPVDLRPQTIPETFHAARHTADFSKITLEYF